MGSLDEPIDLADGQRLGDGLTLFGAGQSERRIVRDHAFARQEFEQRAPRR